MRRMHTQWLVVCLLLGGGVAYAQGPAQQAGPAAADMIRLRNLTALGSRAVLETPVYETTAGRGSTPPQEWHVVTVQYDALADWIDEITVQFYVLARMRDPETGGNLYSLFRKTVTYVDIEKGRSRYALAFLRPAGAKRYGRVVAGAAIITIGGEVIAAPNDASVDLPENWWENPVVLDSPSLTIRDGYLLDRSQTPWAFVNFDEYEFIR